MYEISLKTLIKEECEKNALFRRGYQLSGELAIFFLITRLLAPITVWFTTKSISGFSMDAVFVILMSVCIFFLAREGGRMYAGALCIISAILFTLSGWRGVETAGKTFMEVYRSGTYSNYQLFLCLIDLFIGVYYLTNKKILFFSQRCQALSKKMNDQIAKMRAAEDGAMSAKDRREEYESNKRGLKRTYIFALLLFVLFLGAGISMTGSFTEHPEYDSLPYVEAKYVSAVETSVENTYRITLEGYEDHPFGVPAMYHFPMDQFFSDVKEGDMVQIRTLGDDWNTIVELDANGVSYMDYDTIISIDQQNSRTANKIIFAFYLALNVAAGTIFLIKKKRLGEG